MELRGRVTTKGLDKHKIKIMAIGGALVFMVVLLYLINYHPARDSKAAKLPENFAKNDTEADISNIVNVKKISSSPFKAIASSVLPVNPLQPGLQSQVAQLEQARLQAIDTRMKAPLSSNTLTPMSGGGGTANAGADNMSNDAGLSKDDPNQTSEKRNFIKNQANSTTDILSSGLNDPLAAMVLAMGTKIPAQLDQEINSDLPGQIYGHVSRDVYDSRTHTHLLIPAGSNLVGTYDSAIAYGQERLLVAWKRVNFPNGQWINLQGMGGADPVGAGFGDQVDNHYWRIFGATFLTSVLAAGAQLSQPQQSDALQSPGVGQTLGQSVGTQIAATGTMLAQKNINIQPTIHIRSGFEFTVEVNKDMIFKREYTANSNKS